MLRRNLTSQIHEALSDTPVVFLAGARQTGKSTLVKHLAEEGYTAQYISLDDYTILAAAKYFISELLQEKRSISFWKMLVGDVWGSK